MHRYRLYGVFIDTPIAQAGLDSKNAEGQRKVALSLAAVLTVRG